MWNIYYSIHAVEFTEENATMNYQHALTFDFYQIDNRNCVFFKIEKEKSLIKHIDW